MLDFQQKKQLSILVKIAMVDEDFAEQEKNVIRKISKKYGASEEELQEIFNSPDYNESLAPMSVMDKMDFMMDCMLVVLADEMITSSEEYFARQMASKLGFDQEVVAYLISHKDTSREEMRELMLPFMTA
ncbi:hypothetical protein [Marinoscillum sp.]|uniref:hypothetical protein n=1 Tax=Marinoscillum sp. TaxID=2024838 RepID=UPI003BAB741B